MSTRILTKVVDGFRGSACAWGEISLELDCELARARKYSLFFTTLGLCTSQGDIVLAAGPMLDEGGKMCGSLVFVRGEEVRLSLESRNQGPKH
jgi:hypothetical protein